MAVPRIGAHRPLLAFIRRAAVLYVVLRLLITAFSAAAEDQAGVPADNPFVVVILVTASGLIDVRRRGEAMLWGNLGYSQLILGGILASIAIVGEVALRVVR